MKYSEVANRYAVALFDIASENGTADICLNELQALESAVQKDANLGQFISSPLVPASEKEKVINKTLVDKNAPEELSSFVALLAKKGRLGLIGEVVQAFQACDDQQKKITRGVVKSASALNEKQKNEITQTISGITKKQVILDFEEDKSLIGGLVAQVGSLTFDDTLASHLRRMKEDLNRRMN